jgi:hypothetical protein
VTNSSSVIGRPGSSHDALRHKPAGLQDNDGLRNGISLALVFNLSLRDLLGNRHCQSENMILAGRATALGSTDFPRIP